MRQKLAFFRKTENLENTSQLKISLKYFFVRSGTRRVAKEILLSPEKYEQTEPETKKTSTRPANTPSKHSK